MNTNFGLIGYPIIFLTAALAACAGNQVHKTVFIQSDPRSCAPRLLGSFAVPTEKVARSIYLAVYQGVADKQNPESAIDVAKNLSRNGWKIVVVDDGDKWEVFPENDALQGLAGGGFSTTIEKCSGRVLAAGYAR